MRALLVPPRSQLAGLWPVPPAVDWRYGLVSSAAEGEAPVPWAVCRCGQSPSPRDCAVAILEGAGRAVFGQCGQAHDCIRALGDRLGAAVVVEVGSGKAGVGCVYQDPVEGPRVLDG